MISPPWITYQGLFVFGSEFIEIATNPKNPNQQNFTLILAWELFSMVWLDYMVSSIYWRMEMPTLMADLIVSRFVWCSLKPNTCVLILSFIKVPWWHWKLGWRSQRLIIEELRPNWCFLSNPNKVMENSNFVFPLFSWLYCLAWVLGLLLTTKY